MIGDIKKKNKMLKDLRIFGMPKISIFSSIFLTENFYWLFSSALTFRKCF